MGALLGRISNLGLSRLAGHHQDVGLGFAAQALEFRINYDLEAGFGANMGSGFRIWGLGLAFGSFCVCNVEA